MTAGLHVSPQAKACWRLLRDEGGYWTAGEVAQKLLPDVVPSARARVAGRWLSALKKRNCVVARPTSFGDQSYGVTPRCFAPTGETMEGAAA